MKQALISSEDYEIGSEPSGVVPVLYPEIESYNIHKKHSRGSINIKKLKKHSFFKIIMSRTEKLKSFIIQSKRVWQILKKPSSVEFKTVAKISAIGILVLGAIGFIIADGIRIFTGLFS